MTNLQPEYCNSISINALVLLCIGFNEFDIHKKGIQLSQFISHLVIEQSRQKLQGITKEKEETQPKLLTITPSPETIFGKFNSSSKQEDDVMFELVIIRNNIVSTVEADVLQEHESDTRDCGEIRINFSSAEDWLTENYNTEDINDYAGKWRTDKKRNVFLTVYALYKLFEEEHQRYLSLATSMQVKSKVIKFNNESIADEIKNTIKKNIASDENIDAQIFARILSYAKKNQ